MNTSFDELYERFLSKIEDYEIKDVIIEDQDLAKQILKGYLQSAVPKYIYSNQDLSKRDDSQQTFLVSLTELDKEIITLLMVSEFLSPKLVKSEFLEQRLGTSDFRQYSPASLMSEIRELKNKVETEAKDLMVFQYYRGDY